jgi:hypothetical protein
VGGACTSGEAGSTDCVPKHLEYAIPCHGQHFHVFLLSLEGDTLAPGDYCHLLRVCDDSLPCPRDNLRPKIHVDIPSLLAAITAQPASRRFGPGAVALSKKSSKEVILMAQYVYAFRWAATAETQAAQIGSGGCLPRISPRRAEAGNNMPRNRGAGVSHTLGRRYGCAWYCRARVVLLETQLHYGK